MFRLLTDITSILNLRHFVLLILLFANTLCYAQSFKFTDTSFQRNSYIRFHYSINLDHGSCTVYPCYEYNKEFYDSLVSFLNAHPTFKIEIGSHVDMNSSDSLDKHLMMSEYEAVSMKGVLIRFGIDQRRITAKGYGNTKRVNEKPQVDKLEYDKQIQARFENTRIEITLVEI